MYNNILYSLRDVIVLIKASAKLREVMDNAELKKKKRRMVSVLNLIIRFSFTSIIISTLKFIQYRLQKERYIFVLREFPMKTITSSANC